MVGSWLIAGTALKFLCFNLYYSTDLEVHQYWIALTGVKHWSEWYTDSSSEWSLDYPPAFAIFQLLLYWILSGTSAIIKLFPTASKIQEIAAAIDLAVHFPTQPLTHSPTAVYILRTTVVASDIILIIGLYQYLSFRLPKIKKVGNSWKEDSFLIAFILGYMNVGLIMVDHIHFQYNGMVIGVLILLVTQIEQGNYVMGVVIWCILVSLKHTYLGCGPILVVYVVRKNFQSISDTNWKVLFNCLFFGMMTLAIFFGPFIYIGQFSIVLSRLFPFHRGLCHAYWAPNFWALYTAADKCLAKVLPRLGLGVWVTVAGAGSFTGGKIDVFQHQVLPAISPSMCTIIVLLAILPVLLKAWNNPNSFDFTLGIAYCLLSMFMFGYHIHEKAIIPVIILVGLVAVSNNKVWKLHMVMSCVGHYSLTPLFFTPTEITIVCVLQIAFYALEYYFGTIRNKKRSNSILLVLVAVVLMQTVSNVVKYKIPQLPFLPLAITSTSAALAISASWIKLKNQVLT